MAATVVQVGPGTVQVLAGGAGHGVPADLAAAALDWIDDPVGLLDESPVAVADLWRAVMVAVAGDRCESVVVVHPEDWPARRVGRVLAAANTVADRVSAVGRSAWSGPQGGPEIEPPARRRPGHRGIATAGGVAVLLAVALAAAVGLERPPRGEPRPAELVEGRVAVEVPPDWIVERITGGPGSRRVQVSAPAEPGVALHITQSYAPETTLAETAAVLSTAIAGQPAGVFVDLRSAEDVAGRPAVTYREIRPGRVIRWVVLATGVGRISIGCQNPAGREDAVAAACARAVRSARHR